MNGWWSVKFTKHSHCQTFPQYGIIQEVSELCLQGEMHPLFEIHWELIEVKFIENYKIHHEIRITE